jgi:hypothetical protein
MLKEGYNGVHAPFLTESTTRAAWSHMLMQSPWGEIPTGGRSSQHQWNEAVQTLAYEIQATRFKAAGDNQAACMFQRAARLSHASLRRWQNSGAAGHGNASMSGALQVVKNWFPPTARWGYEEYTFLSQYNLLPAAMMAAAWTYADETDSIPECPAPSDVGGFVFQLPEHRLVIASLGGVYLQVETGADPKYEPTGFHRLHINTCGVGAAGSCVSVHPVLGPTAGPPYYPPAGVPPQGVSIGPWWSTADAPGNVTSLGALSFTDVAAVTLVPGWNTNGTSLSFAVEYYLLSRGVLVTQSYTLSIGQGGSQPAVEVAHKVQVLGGDAMVARALAHGEDLLATAPYHVSMAKAAGVFAPTWSASPSATLSRFGLQYPLFMYDGQTNSTVSVDSAANTVTVSGPAGSGWGSIVHTPIAPAAGHSYTWTYDPTKTVVSRNGLMGTAWLETSFSTQAPYLTSTVTGVNGA